MFLPNVHACLGGSRVTTLRKQESRTRTSTAVPVLPRTNPLLVVLMAVLLVAPYFRGLYFPGEQLAVALVLAVLFIVRWAQKFAAGDYTFIAGRLDALIWGLAAVYVVALAVAVEVRAAVQEVIKVASCAVMYWLVQDLARHRGAVRQVLHAVLAAGVYVAALGIAAAAGHFTLEDAIMGNRIASTLQYPNSLAAYLTLTFIVGITLWLTAGRRREAAWSAAAAYACLFVIVFTYSRGGWLVFALMVLLLPLLQPAGQRLPALLSLVWTGIVFAPFGYLYTRFQAAGSATGIWTAFLAGLVPASAGPWLTSALQRLRPSAQRLLIGGAAAAVAAGVAYIIANPSVMPARILHRLQDINLETYSAWTRIQWFRDALSMIAERPILGAGGGAWDAMYHAYQSYNYFSPQVHNHFLQLWLEVGTVGFVVWLGIWVALGLSAWRAYRAAPEPADRSLVAGATAGAVALGLHSLIDYDLALTAVALTLWAVFGSVRALEKIHTGFYDSARHRLTGSVLWPRLAVYGGAGLVALVIVSLWIGFWQGQEAVRAVNRDEIAVAVNHLERAMTFDPLTATYPVDLAHLITLRRPLTAGDFAEARALMERGLRLAPYRATLHAQYGAFLIRYGQFDEGLAALQRATELHPYETNYWEDLARGHVVVAEARLKDGSDRTEVATNLEQVLGIADRIEELRQQVKAVVPEHLRQPDFAPSITPPLALDLGRAAALLGRWQQAEAYLRQAAESGDWDESVEAHVEDRAEAVLWLAAVLERTGRAAEAGELVAPAIDQNPDLEARLAEIRELLPD